MHAPGVAHEADEPLPVVSKGRRGSLKLFLQHRYARPNQQRSDPTYAAARRMVIHPRGGRHQDLLRQALRLDRLGQVVKHYRKPRPPSSGVKSEDEGERISPRDTFH